MDESRRKPRARVSESRSRAVDAEGKQTRSRCESRDATQWLDSRPLSLLSVKGLKRNSTSQCHSEASEESLIGTQFSCAMKRKSGCFAPLKIARRLIGLLGLNPVPVLAFSAQERK